MRLIHFRPAIGQRYIYRQAGVVDQVWFIASIAAPTFLYESEQLTFSDEITQQRTTMSSTHLAQKILEGILVLQSSASQSAQVAPLALADLVYRMSVKQQRRFAQRASYVLELEKTCSSLSSKSKDFNTCITSHHAARLESYKLRSSCMGTNPMYAMEEHCPAPSTVYQWYLDYRKAGNDVRVFALEAIVTRTRTARKPNDKMLLSAFLESELAETCNRTVASLTQDFNRLLKNTDPLKIDDVMEELQKKKEITMTQNRDARRGKGSMRRPRTSSI